jgi:hypothetical protein
MIRQYKWDLSDGLTIFLKKDPVERLDPETYVLFIVLNGEEESIDYNFDSVSMFEIDVMTKSLEYWHQDYNYEEILKVFNEATALVALFRKE